jgi:hypothetical protein
MDAVLYTDMRVTAYQHPLVRAQAATLPYFRQIDAETAVGLTVNK